MATTTPEDIDLIDDIWQRIFSSLDYRCRVSLFRISKRWKALASNPVCWTFLDVTLPSEREPEASERTALFCKFVAKYCSLTTKIKIEKEDSFMFWTIMQALFPLRHLRYLKMIVRGGGAYQPLNGSLFPKPDWSNLIYLNLQLHEAQLLNEGWAWVRLTEGAPNLEEIHLAQTRPRMDRTSFVNGLANCQKLKLLTMPDVSRLTTGATNPGPQIQQVVVMESIYELLPDLQTVIIPTIEKGLRVGGFGQGFGPATLFGAPQAFGGGFGQGFGAPANSTLFGAPQAFGGGFGQGFAHANPTQFGGGFGAPATPPLFGGPPPFGEQQQTEKLSLEYHGNTLVVTEEILRSRDLEIVTKIGHLLKKTNYVGYFMRRLNSAGGLEQLTAPLMHYLINELKLDINRSSAQADPFAVDVFRVEAFSPVYPLSSVLDDVEQVQLMLDFGADPNCPDGVPPLGFGTISKDSCILLLERGADPLKQVDRAPVICRWFTKFSDQDLAEILTVVLNKGLIEVNQKIDGSKTLLDFAVANEHSLTIQELLARGARWTPRAMDKLIHWDLNKCSDVMTSGKFDVSQLLLGTALTAIQRDMYPLVREHLQNLPRDLDQNGFGVVHYLSLLQQNAMPSQAKTGITGTFWGEDSATVAPIESAEQSLRELDKMIKELNLDVNLKTSNGETPLLLVCSDVKENVGVVNALLDNGANINEPDIHGWTPLHAALFGGKRETAQLLLSRGANINAQDKLGITPVMAFSLSSSLDDNKILPLWNIIVEHGFDVALPDKILHRSILHHLTAFGTCKCVEILLDKVPGLDINCRDVHGFTPLHYAARAEDQQMMKLLVERGADTNATSTVLKLTPFAVLLALYSQTSPYTIYVTHYGHMNRDKTLDEKVDIIVDPDATVALCKLKKPVWCVDKVSNTFSFRSEPGTISPRFIPWPTDLSLTDRFGNNSLHTLVMVSGCGQQNSPLRSGGLSKEWHKLWSKPNKRGTTPFHMFVQNYVPPEIDYLTELLTSEQHELLYSLNNKDEHGKTALEYLLDNGHVHAIANKLFNIKGINFTSPSVLPPPTSLLHSTIAHRNVRTELLTKLAETDPSALNLKVNGKTPLVLFVEKLLTDPDLFREDSLLDCFLECKVDLNAQDNEGNTALHYACYFFHLGAWDSYHVQSHTLQGSCVFSVTLFKLLEGKN